MLKKTVMAAVTTLLATISLSAQPDKNAAKKETDAPPKNPSVVLAAPSHQNDGKANTAKPSTDPPASHVPFKDPNWVLVIVGSITCGVISWQSRETRRAAKASEKAIILQFRPKVIVRHVGLRREDSHSETTGGQKLYTVESWAFDLQIENIGGTHAVVQLGTVKIEWFSPPCIFEPEGESNFGEFPLKSGDERLITISIPERGSHIETRLRHQKRSPMLKGNPAQILQVVGCLRYRDELGTTRKTGFLRTWDPRLERFIPSTDPEVEYQD